MKKCRGCGLILADEEFYRHSRMSDGRLNHCKECVKERVRTHRAENVEKYRAHDRKRYAGDERRRSRGAAAAKSWRTANPEKYKAQCTANNALRDGKIERRMECEACGAKGVLHKHHPDYKKPLSVVWLCPSCHSGKNKEIVLYVPESVDNITDPGIYWNSHSPRMGSG